MISDLNKGIVEILYNHLNLPTEIRWAANKKINYLYNAAGQKVKKTVLDGTTIKNDEYLDGFQYTGGILQFFSHPEGYVKATPGIATPTSPPTSYLYNYVYNYTDHLGNVRLSYTKDPLTNQLKIMDETHYYPFGLKHEVYVSGPIRDCRGNPDDNEPALINVTKTDYKYKYNGKEFQDELGLGLYDYGARNYDPALGRFFNLDRVSEKYEAISPYGYVANNHVRNIDINGEWIYIDDGENKYRYQNGKIQHQVDGEWTAIDETVNISDYVIGMVTELNNLKEKSETTGAGLINHFSNDKNNVTFMDNGGGENNYNGDTGIINYGLSKFDQTHTQKGYIDQPHYVGIGHELGHGKDPSNYYSGLGGTWYSTASRGEIYASHIENMIRAESGLPLRTHYGSILNSAGNRNLPHPASALIDKNGHSIHYTSGGSQRDFNLSVGISQAVNGGQTVIEMYKNRAKVNIGFGKTAEVKNAPYIYSK